MDKIVVNSDIMVSNMPINNDFDKVYISESDEEKLRKTYEKSLRGESKTYTINEARAIIDVVIAKYR